VGTPAPVLAGLPSAQLTETHADLCAICMCAMAAGEVATRLGCGHALHAPCAAAWLRRATWCPLCKASVL